MTTYIHTFRDAAVDACLQPTELAVLMVLARYADSNTGATWPGHELVGSKISRTAKSVQRTIEGLIEKGWLIKTRSGSNTSGRGGIPNEYRLVIPEGDVKAAERPTLGKPPVAPAKPKTPERPTPGKPPVVPPVEEPKPARRALTDQSDEDTSTPIDGMTPDELRRWQRDVQAAARSLPRGEARVGDF